MKLSKSNLALVEFFAAGNNITADGVPIRPDGSLFRVFSVKTRLRPAFRAYPAITFNGLPIYIHRLCAFKNFGFAIFAEGVEVRHRDDNPLNCSLLNIILGSQSDNRRDIPAVERSAIARRAADTTRRKYGKNGCRVLSDHAVLAIRAASTAISHCALGRCYDIDSSAIRKIRLQLTYKNVSAEATA